MITCGTWQKQSSLLCCLSLLYRHTIKSSAEYLASISCVQSSNNLPWARFWILILEGCVKKIAVWPVMYYSTNTFFLAVVNRQRRRWILNTVISFHFMGSRILYYICMFQITQIEFSERAPAGCRQYHQGSNGMCINNLLLSFAELTIFERYRD
jgi:hypothetical protein